MGLKAGQTLLKRRQVNLKTWTRNDPSKHRKEKWLKKNEERLNGL